MVLCNECHKQPAVILCTCGKHNLCQQCGARFLHRPDVQVKFKCKICSHQLEDHKPQVNSKWMKCSKGSCQCQRYEW